MPLLVPESMSAFEREAEIVAQRVVGLLLAKWRLSDAESQFVGGLLCINLLRLFQVRDQVLRRATPILRFGSKFM